MSGIRASSRRAAGFTLVEVLVALFIMAILAALAFRGIDALVHAKTASQAATDRTLQMNTGMSQFEYDVSQIVDSKGGIPSPILFDGSTLRFARHANGGLQLVLWTLQGRRWQRWASAPVTHLSQLQDAYFQSTQWDSISGNAVTVLNDVDGFQAYAYNSGWTNLQSTQTSNVTTTQTSNTTPGTSVTTVTKLTYTGLRITLKVPGGDISREKELPAL